MEQAARAATELGHEVEEGARFDATLDEFLPIFHYMIGSMFIPFSRTMQPSTRHLQSIGKSVRLADASARRDLFQRRVDASTEGVDIWITPTVPHFAPTVGAYRQTPPERLLDEVAPYGAYTAVFNASGNPATSIPYGRSKSGLPIGLQIIGRRDEDVTVLRLARQLMQGGLAPLATIA